MALTIWNKTKGTSQTHHIPFNSLKYSNIDLNSDYLIVQADGHELEEILNKISNIKMSKNPVIRWFGDDAKFIIANL